MGEFVFLSVEEEERRILQPFQSFQSTSIHFRDIKVGQMGTVNTQGTMVRCVLLWPLFGLAR